MKRRTGFTTVWVAGVALLAACEGGSGDGSRTATPTAPASTPILRMSPEPTVRPTALPASPTLSPTVADAHTPPPTLVPTTSLTPSPSFTGTGTSTPVVTSTASSTATPQPTGTPTATPTAGSSVKPVIELLQVIRETSAVSALAVSSDGRQVYVNSDDPVLGRDILTGELAMPAAKSPAAHFIALTTSPDGRHLYAIGSVANGTRGMIALARDRESGRLDVIDVVPGRSDDEPEGLRQLNDAFALAISPDGMHVYATGVRATLVFERDSASGRLAFIEAHGPASDPLIAQRSMSIAISSDGRNVYIARFADDGLDVFRRDPVTGRLILLEQHFDGDPGIEGLDDASAVVLSPDGLNVYVAQLSAPLPTAPALLSTFRRDELSGRLTPEGSLPLTPLFSLAVAPNGRYVYAPGFGAVGVLERDPQDGSLELVEWVDAGLTRLRWVAVSPDGANVYAGGDTGLVSYRVISAAPAGASATAADDADGSLFDRQRGTAP